MRWLDTNVILRLLTADDPLKAESCLALLQRVRRGEEELATADIIVAEVVCVLRSQYHLSHAEIAAALRPLIALTGLRLPQKRVVQQALDIYEEFPRLDFEDALSVALMRQLRIDAIVSYDRDFDRVPDIVRQEP